MQQTETYQLNLIETSDVFSPAPLNENAEKTEAALAALTASVQAEAAARTETDAALDSRVTVLEAKKMVVGTYQGAAASARDISLGFQPMAVFLYRPRYPEIWFISSAKPAGSYWHITDSGFSVDSKPNYGNHEMNNTSEEYLYLALG